MPHNFEDNWASCVARIMQKTGLRLEFSAEFSKNKRHRLKAIKQVNKYGNNFPLLCCGVVHCSVISAVNIE